MILPAVTLSLFSIAAISRLTRSAMLNVLGSDYVKMARLKGCSEGRVIWSDCQMMRHKGAVGGSRFTATRK
jgi:peptide/nickel transport system permease protein